MRTKLFFLVCLHFVAIYSSAQIPLPKKGEYTTITTRRGDRPPLDLSVSANSERIKTRFEIDNDSLLFCFLYINEYVDGERVINTSFDRLYAFGGLKKGSMCFWEMIPDISAGDSLKLVFNFPGFATMREKKTLPGKCFKYVSYEHASSFMQKEETPLLLIYEDDTDTGETEKIVQKYLKNGLLKSNSKEILSKIERYFIVYYTHKEKKS